MQNKKKNNKQKKIKKDKKNSQNQHKFSKNCTIFDII